MNAIPPPDGEAANPGHPATRGAGILTGTVALVSGVGHQPGDEIARLLAGLGARLAVCGPDQESLTATARHLREAGAADLLAHPVDTTDPARIETLMDAAWNHFGQVDMLVNAMAAQSTHRALDCPPGQWLAVVDTNLNGTWYMMHAMARRWRDTGRPGSIVNIVPTFQRGIPGAAHASAAGAGVAHLCKAVAVEWAQYRIRVNCVATGVIAGAQAPARTIAAGASVDRANPLRRAGKPGDVAEAVAYLVAPTGEFITGEVLTVDGGGVLWGEAWPIAQPDYFKVTA